MKLFQIRFGNSEGYQKIIGLSIGFFIVLYSVTYELTVLFTIYHNVGPGTNIFIHSLFEIPELHLGLQLLLGLIPLISLLIVLVIAVFTLQFQINNNMIEDLS